MEIISRRSSSSSSVSALNPNAPVFVPISYRTVEDFSDQWWALIQSSPWFREYWLQERFQDPQDDPSFSDIENLFLTDLEDFDHQQKEEELEYSKDLVPIGAFKWRKNRITAEIPKFAEKAPRNVNVKVSPRMIHQPR